MKILSIETSCDETGITILEAKENKSENSKSVSFEILADSLASQIKIHAPYGGVFPALAKREHIKNLPILLEKTLKKAKVTLEKIDLIAVTSGPGLEPALWTGIVFAKELSKKWNIPVIPVNHMEGHIFSIFADAQKFEIALDGKEKIKFPALALLVSGGHTELILIKDFLKYEKIGETLDDAAGEAFDKVARMLSLPYPGGPEISKLAELGRKKEITYDFTLPRPMLYSKNFDFSFSGLKTAVLYLTKKIGKLNEKTKTAIALEFENAVIETLVHKTKKAVEKYNIQTLLVAGGVASNKYLRKEIKKTFKKQEIFFPNKKLSTDNSVMIGIAGYFRFLDKKGKTKKASNIKAEGNLEL